MKATTSDRIRIQHKVYLEPVVITATVHQAGKSTLRTVSRYCRMAVLEKLARDGYPLSTVCPRIHNELRRAITALA